MTTLDSVSLRIQAKFARQLAEELGDSSKLDAFMLQCCQGQDYEINVTSVATTYPLVGLAKAFISSVSSRRMPMPNIVSACMTFALSKSLQLLVDEGIVSAAHAWLPKISAQAPHRPRNSEELRQSSLEFARNEEFYAKERPKLVDGRWYLIHNQAIVVASDNKNAIVAELCRLPSDEYLIVQKGEESTVYDMGSHAYAAEEKVDAVKHLETWYKNQAALQEEQPIKQFERRRLDIETNLLREREASERLIKEEFQKTIAAMEAKHRTEVAALKEEIARLRETH